MGEDFKNMERLEKQLGVEIVSYGLGCDEYRYEITNEDKYFDCKNRSAREQLDLLCETAERGYIEHIEGF